MIDRGVIAFRVDASPVIGSGHVMRCLSLARALMNRGASAIFVTRAIPAPLRVLSEALGVKIAPMPATEPSEFNSDLAHGHWLGAAPEDDAAATLHALGKVSPAWLIVDHYGIDAHWHSFLRPHVQRIAVIDDLADRNHDCDVLIDANLSAVSERRYLTRTAETTALCLGPRYAMLRPEFAAKARELLRSFGEVGRILVSFGGFDVANHTKISLQALEHCGFEGCVDVVVGQGHPEVQELTTMVGAKSNWSLHVQTLRMADLMASADFAIGAGGTTVYERACLGLPSLAICAAGNQRAQLQHAEAAGILTNVSPDSFSVEALSKAIMGMISVPDRLLEQSRKGSELVDGLGADRIAKLLMADGPITVRPAAIGDALTVLEWRNTEAVRMFSGDAAVIATQDHMVWFAKHLLSETCITLIGQCEGEDCGVARFDIEGETATVSIFLAPAFMGRGIGLNLLLVAERKLVGRLPKVKSCIGRVSAGNTASASMFFSAGYDQVEGLWCKRV